MYDRVAAQRRRLPMVKMDKPYRFAGAEGDVTFAGLFAGQRQLSGIPFPFYSSFESDFNYDMQMSDERGEGQGISVFFRLGDAVFHTYTALQRGVEGFNSAQAFLDRTPYGRQQDFEDSPAGWPQYLTYG